MQLRNKTPPHLQGHWGLLAGASSDFSMPGVAFASQPSFGWGSTGMPHIQLGVRHWLTVAVAVFVWLLWNRKLMASFFNRIRRMARCT